MITCARKTASVWESMQIKKKEKENNREKDVEEKMKNSHFEEKKCWTRGHDFRSVETEWG